jgi:hypothetical protein
MTRSPWIHLGIPAWCGAGSAIHIVSQRGCGLERPPTPEFASGGPGGAGMLLRGCWGGRLVVVDTVEPCGPCGPCGPCRPCGPWTAACAPESWRDRLRTMRPHHTSPAGQGRGLLGFWAAGAVGAGDARHALPALPPAAHARGPAASARLDRDADADDGSTAAAVALVRPSGPLVLRSSGCQAALHVERLDVCGAGACLCAPINHRLLSDCNSPQAAGQRGGGGDTSPGLFCRAGAERHLRHSLGACRAKLRLECGETGALSGPAMQIWSPVTTCKTCKLPLHRRSSCASCAAAASQPADARRSHLSSHCSPAPFLARCALPSPSAAARRLCLPVVTLCRRPPDELQHLVVVGEEPWPTGGQQRAAAAGTVGTVGTAGDDGDDDDDGGHGEEPPLPPLSGRGIVVHLRMGSQPSYK